MYNWKFELYKLNNTLCLPAPKPTKEDLDLLYEQGVYNQMKKLTQRERCVEMGKCFYGKTTNASTVKVKVLRQLNAEYFKSRNLVIYPLGSYYRYIEKKWADKFIDSRALHLVDGALQIKDAKKLNEMNEEYKKYQRTPQALLI